MKTIKITILAIDLILEMFSSSRINKITTEVCPENREEIRPAIKYAICNSDEMEGVDIPEKEEEYYLNGSSSVIYYAFG